MSPRTGYKYLEPEALARVKNLSMVARGVVEARAGQVTLTSDKLVAEVGRVNLEFEKLDMDDKMLAQIAAETRGRYVHLSTASTLIDQLDRSQRQQSELRKTDLYRPAGLFWAVFVALVSTEWYLRRRFLLR